MRVLAHVSASLFAADTGYRRNYLEILGLKPDDEFPIVQSRSGFAFAGWLPPEEFLIRSEQEATDYSGSLTHGIAYRRNNLEFVEALLKTLEPRTRAQSPLRLLDFGCGFGFMLRSLGSKEILAFGYDFSSIQRTVAAKNSGERIFSTLDEVRAGGPYDAFVCSEVLEHLPDPRSALRFMKSVARPRAVLAVTVPNCTPKYIDDAMADFAATGNFHLVFNPLVHLNHFSDQTLRQLLGEEGFTVVYDFGRTCAIRDAVSQFGGEPLRDFFKNVARVAKRAWMSPPSTQLFCQISA